MIFSYKSLESWYTQIADFVRYSDYTLTEVKQMIPYEWIVYHSILINQLEEEKKKRK